MLSCYFGAVYHIYCVLRYWSQQSYPPPYLIKGSDLRVFSKLLSTREILDVINHIPNSIILAMSLSDGKEYEPGPEAALTDQVP
jgi:hypothetical protein